MEGEVIILDNSEDSRRDDIGQLFEILQKILPESKNKLKMLTGVDGGENHSYIPISGEYYMQFKASREAIFLSKLNYCDIYTYLYLCEKYANHNAFFVNAYFWKEILQDVKKLNQSFKRQSIFNSINKLRKNHFVFRTAKATYSINSIFAYSGALDQRNNKIKRDVSDYLIYNNSIK